MTLKYLDYAAATPVDPRVLRTMRPYFSKKFGNPGSLHAAGAEALAALDRAREAVAKATGVGFRSVVFTASATEANNLALRGTVKQFLISHFKFLKGKTKIIVSAVEHDSVLETAREMERAGEIELVAVPVDRKGVVDLKKLEAALDPHTALVSVMYVNNEVGTVQPVSDISQLVKKFRNEKKSGADRASNRYPRFHTDASQALLYYPCRMDELGADLMTLSSQKIYGPKGAGVLILPTPHLLLAALTGGGQEFGLRAGTENVPSIVGFAAAMELAEKERATNVKHATKVRDAFIAALTKEVRGVEENGGGRLPAGRKAPHIANLAFPAGVSSEDLLVLFDRAGIAASPGAACSARALTLSHVLQALGVPEERIRRSILFSVGKGTTENDAREAARGVAKAVRYILNRKS